jgi:GNAT superfamily N-acetyltransferase
MRFKKAELSDIDSIVALVNSAYRGEFAKKGWTTEADILDGQRTDPEGIRELILNHDSEIQLALEENELQGCIYIRREPESVYFGMLTVKPNLQNKGMGKVLLARLEELAKTWGFRTIRMTVISLRHELIQFYERRGYKRTGKTEPFPEHDPRFGLPKVSNLVFEEFAKTI